MRRPGTMLKTVLGSIFKKPATSRYPFVKFPMPDKFRGKIIFHADACIGCKMCMKDCPSNAIDIIKLADKKFQCEIKLGKCIYCAQCVDSCPKKALEATRDFELAQLDPSKLKVIYPPAPATLSGQTPADVTPDKTVK